MKNPEIYSRLVKLQSAIYRGEYPSTGICPALEKDHSWKEQEIQMHLKDAFVQWPEFSGSHYFPIGQFERDGKRLYQVIPTYFHNPLLGVHENDTQWYWSTRSAYGRKRRELLEWLIQYFK